ncbi:MAG: hypothetical protein M1818_008296 [Claussenomyces sp. TS43310]|nr:MAG: hypothetical protein M1818_008296 [Claussenomyces sp. TS43310]
MPEHDFTDQYVGELLAKDARDNSVKYSALGIEAFMPSKPPTNKPKPNTRFLRTIIKETDNHNAALLAKEATESRARLEHLETKESRAGSDIRKRQLGLIAAHLKGKPKPRRSADERDSHGKREAYSGSEKGPGEKDCERRQRGRDKDRIDDMEDLSYRRSYRRHGSRSRERRYHLHGHRSSHRSQSPRDEKDSRYRHRSSRRATARSPSRGVKKIEKDDEKGGLGRIRRRSPSPLESLMRQSKVSRREESSALPPEEVDSDPLDDIIGPRPPPVSKVQSRGRGATSFASGIDSRFSSSYNPTVDVEFDPGEENDWDQALEALRDRQKWKQQGADRLRAAGFSDEEVKKWEKGGEKREEDVKWVKRGEEKEWDRGKVFDSSPEDVLVKMRSQGKSWGRLEDI